MSKANKYPLDEEQEALLADFICQQVNRAYSIGFLIGFRTAISTDWHSHLLLFYLTLSEGDLYEIAG